jgi:regulator of sigma E protease
MYLTVIPGVDGKIWSYLIPNTQLNKDFKYKYWFIDSVKYGTLETYGQIILTFKWIKMLLTKIVNPKTPQERQEAIDQVSWPIGMVHFMTKTLWNGLVFICIIWAIISINLWTFNLLPIPALDGWRFFLIVINGFVQKIFWKKAINEKFEWLLHIGFFIFLIALSALIAYNDVYKLITNH